MISNKKRLLDTEHFCILPFVSSRIWHTAVVPCCVNHETVFGRTTEESLEEIYSNDNPILKDFRKQMINGPKLSESCQRCTDCERSGVKSYRQVNNEKYGHLIDELDFDDQGNLTEFKVHMWDGVGYTNLCNLKCRMCHSYLSTTNREEEVKHNLPMKSVSIVQKKQLENFKDLLPKVLINSFDNIEDLYNFFYDHIDTTKEIKFEGGEPLIMEEHYKLLMLLLDRGKTDVILNYPTNLTKLKLKDYDCIELWKQFKQINICVSLDAFDLQNRYIRHPADWAQIIRNLERIQKECPHINLTVQTTIQILNSFAATKLHKWATDLELPVNFVFLKYPLNMSLTSLTIEYKNKVKQHWNEYKIRAPIHTHKDIDGFLKMMEAEDTSETLGEFFTLMKERDHVRNENLFETFPELIELDKNDKRD